jgi:hypothetical protein
MFFIYRNPKRKAKGKTMSTQDPIAAATQGLIGSPAVIPDATPETFAAYVSRYWGQKMPNGQPWTANIINMLTGISVAALVLFQEWCSSQPAGTSAAVLIATTQITLWPGGTSITSTAPASNVPVKITVGGLTFDELYALFHAKNPVVFT